MSAATLPLPCGIRLADDDEVSKQLEAISVAADESPRQLAMKTEQLLAILQQIHVTTRENNAILNDLMLSMEERLNARMDRIKEEVLELLASPSSLSAAGSDKNRWKSALTSAEKVSRCIDSPAPTEACQYESVVVTPMPGFVIKTRKLLGAKDKVFINVFHHEAVEIEPSHVNRSAADNRPYLIIGDVASLLDKEGHSCAIFNVAVSSEYFKPQGPVDLRITAPSSIQKIIRKVNTQHSCFLDESNYVLPRSSSGYKGDGVPQFTVMVATKPPAPQPQPSPEEAAAGGSRPSHHDVASDLAFSEALSATANKKMVPRKSFFDGSQLGSEGSIAGRNLLSSDMLTFVKEESLDNQSADTLRVSAVDNPALLLGWQITMVDNSKKPEIFVVTGVRKNYLSKTEFRVSRFFVEDVWVRLKRAEGKSGFDFRPMRKVLFGLVDDDAP